MRKGYTKAKENVSDMLEQRATQRSLKLFMPATEINLKSTVVQGAMANEKRKENDNAVECANRIHCSDCSRHPIPLLTNRANADPNVWFAVACPHYLIRS